MGEGVYNFTLYVWGLGNDPGSRWWEVSGRNRTSTNRSWAYYATITSQIPSGLADGGLDGVLDCGKKSEIYKSVGDGGEVVEGI